MQKCGGVVEGLETGRSENAGGDTPGVVDGGGVRFALPGELEAGPIVRRNCLASSEGGGEEDEGHGGGEHDLNERCCEGMVEGRERLKEEGNLSAVWDVKVTFGVPGPKNNRAMRV